MCAARDRAAADRRTADRQMRTAQTASGRHRQRHGRRAPRGGGPRARRPARSTSSMFGDEPYGNYNRILLSGVLAGSHDPKDIFINPLAWYEQARRHAARRRARHAHRPRPSAWSSARDGRVEPYDDLVFATGSTPVRAAARGPASPTRGSCRDGVFVFRTLDDCAAIRDYAARRDARRGDRRRPARARGGARAARARLEVHVVHLMPHLMEVQLDAPPATMLRRDDGAAGRDDASRRAGRPPCSATRRSTGLRVRRRHDARLRHGRRLGRHPAERGAGARGRPDASSAASSSATTCARANDPRRLRDRRVRAAPRPGLRPRRAAVGAGEGAGRPPHRTQRATRCTPARAWPPSSR